MKPTESSTGAPTALVTGGARGQGAAHARALAAAGYQVVITDVLDDLGRSTADALTALGLAARYLPHDVTDEDGWRRTTESVLTQEGSLEVLVNNAGIIRVSRLTDLDVAEWELVQRVNTTSVLLGLKVVAPHMAASGGGSIINIASTAAHRGAAGYGAYSASKAAVLALTRAAALEFAPYQIRVNSISPGGVDTPMNDDEPAGGTSSGAPLGRRARPEEISPLVVYLAGADSSFVTGADFLIDGGVTIA